jgi:hypothetical protein
MFTPSEWKSLVGTLLEKTASEEIKWFLNKNGAYQHRLDKGLVLLLRSVDKDDREPYALNVWRATDEPEGKLAVFATLTTGDLQSQWGPEDRLDELFKAVQRQVNGASSVFQTMMDKLGVKQEEKEEEEGNASSTNPEF